MSRFRLKGHANPLEEYPDVVLPVGAFDDGPLVVVYQGTGSTEPIDGGGYVSHNEGLSWQLRNFEPADYRLFAYSPENVVLLQKGGENHFFKDFLYDPIYEDVRPFSRLKFAKASLDPLLVFRELARCVVELKKTPKYLRSWIDGQLADLERSQPGWSIGVAAMAAAMVQTGSAGLVKKKIVLFEDTRQVAALDKAHFEARGYSVWVAEDGIAGLKLVLEIMPDLILLDLRMPQLDGYETLKILKNWDATKKIPVIVRSAQNPDYDRFEATGKKVLTDLGQVVRKDTNNVVRLAVDKEDANLFVGKDHFGDGDVDQAAEMLMAV